MPADPTHALFAELNRRGSLLTPPVPFILRGEGSIAVVGEAPGEEEVRRLQPFVGAAGQELAQEAQDAGFPLSTCSILNVFQTRPPNNDVEQFFGLRKPDLTPEWYASAHAARIPTTPLGSKGFLRPEFHEQAARCLQALLDLEPRLIVTLGNTALWLLTGISGIKKIRGTTTKALYGPVGTKVLPTYHPAAVLRQWSWRPFAVSDLRKAAFEATFPEVRRPRRELWLEPTLQDLDTFAAIHLRGAEAIYFDLETKKHSQISSIALGPSPSVGLCIPFIRSDGSSYWETSEEELKAWDFIRYWLEHLDLPVVELGGHNGIYDIAYLRQVGINARNYKRDTMFGHYAQQPEMEKSLGTLGSLYTNELAWKIERPRAKDEYKSEE